MTFLPGPAAVGLRCLRCGTHVDLHARVYLCAVCGTSADGVDPGVLDVGYDPHRAAAAVARHRAEEHPFVRWSGLLPVVPSTDLPFCGNTPLMALPRLARRLEIGTLLVKDETRNPTRCLKDRATTIAASVARQIGAASTYCASAGNAAISLAGYSAHAGLPCHVFVPAEASPVRLEWLRRSGANLHVSQGGYDDAFEEAEAFGVSAGSYSRNCAYNPFLVEGKKTVALEIGEQLNFRAPDIVAAPVGDGCTLGAIGKGFRELRVLGLTRGIPRLIGAQARGISPIAARFRGEDPAVAAAGRTSAASIAVRRPRNALRVLNEVRESGGAVLPLTEEAIASAQALLAGEAGLVCELTSAAAMAAIQELATIEDLSSRTVILVLTGGRPA